MALPTSFGHDKLAHLLSDKLLTVPKFQRSYSWNEQNVKEYWTDIQKARLSDQGYFMGTVVLAEDTDSPGRMLIVDGQQRLTTTAILLIAIRDRLRDFELDEQWRAVQQKYLSDYVLSQEANIPKLTLSPADSASFLQLLETKTENRTEIKGSILDSYKYLYNEVKQLAPTCNDYSHLIEIATYLSESVQVLTATATDLSEAFVIFETLNDRGADLTTADLLKNFIFSKANSQTMSIVSESWVRLTGAFSKPADFVQFIRYEFMSRNGHVTLRNLYKSIQNDISDRQNSVLTYLENLEKSLRVYKALKEPDNAFWSANSISVKDSLLAFRRLRIEVTNVVLLAAFSNWSITDASRLVNTVSGWAVRAWTTGSLGGGSADTAFSNAAKAISDGSASNIEDLRPYITGIVPDDAKFRNDFMDLGDLNTTVAKYLLGQLEREYRTEIGAQAESMPDWSSRNVTVEHIIAKSSTRENFASNAEFEAFNTIRDRLQNYTPLELSLNATSSDAPFTEKKLNYILSAFELTKAIGINDTWNSESSALRMQTLSRLAVKAWPL